MKTHILGHPRIGPNRELKFALDEVERARRVVVARVLRRRYAE